MLADGNEIKPMVGTFMVHIDTGCTCVFIEYRTGLGEPVGWWKTPLNQGHIEAITEVDPPVKVAEGLVGLRVEVPLQRCPR